MSRAIELFGPHTCTWGYGPFCERRPENVKTRKQRREARRYEAKQTRRRQRRMAFRDKLRKH